MRRGVAYTWVLALVLANLGYLAWRVWIAPPAAGTVPWRAPVGSPPASSVAEGKGTIRLAGEAQGEGAAPSGAGEQGSAPSTVVPVCLLLGPFTEPVATAAALIEVRSRGFAPQVVYPPVVQPRRWIVRIDGLPAEADQTRVLARLRGAGFSDFAALPRETRTYAVSLGVFSAAARAERRLAEVRAAGIEARIVPLYDPVAERWLQVTVDPAALPAGIEPGTAPGAALAGTWRIRPCEAL
jgi:cell division septation protein DedD